MGIAARNARKQPQRCSDSGFQGVNLGIDAAPSLLHRRMARLQHNRRGGGEWPACYGRSGDGLPRPILIFVAAKENGPPATVVAVTAICRLRFYLRLTQRNS